MHSNDPPIGCEPGQIVPAVTTSEDDRRGAGQEGRKDCRVLRARRLSDDRNSRYWNNCNCDRRIRCHSCNLRERFAFEAESARSNLVKRYCGNLGSRVPNVVREFEVRDRMQQRSLLTEQQATGDQEQECFTTFTHGSESHVRNPRPVRFVAALTKARRTLDSNTARKP